jgi:hypothetical protein
MEKRIGTLPAQLRAPLTKDKLIERHRRRLTPV